MTDGEWNPGQKYRMYLNKIQSILGDEERTVRDIYYALEARGFPTELDAHGYDFAYRFVKRAVKKGRRHGYIDPEKVIDTSRRAATFQQGSHSSPESFLRSKVTSIENDYFENFWDDQPTYVEVWLEKASLASVFEPICNEHNVRLEATRGDWSDSKVYEAGQRLVGAMRDGNDVKVLYFGDFNPSGLHAPVSVQETLGHYAIRFPREFGDSSEEGYFEAWPFDAPLAFNEVEGSIAFERVSLTLDEIGRFAEKDYGNRIGLPENPTPSSTDKDRTLRDRFIDRASGGRDVNIELNALKEFEREYLEDRLDDAITKHINYDRREATEERIERRQETISGAIDVDYDVFNGGSE